MRLFLLLLLLTFPSAEAAIRRLATDCVLPPATPTEAEPFDLDICTLGNGDDITLLLTDIQAQWPNAFYVRAPSKTLTVISSFISWPSSTKIYMFFEDQDPLNRMTIQHVAPPTNCVGSACEGFWKLWAFSNFTTVKIGGPNLSVTFRGNHPGWANCDAQQYYIQQVSGGSDAICDTGGGLLDFRMTNGTMATLVDVRANVRYSQHYGLYMWGGEHYYNPDTNDSVQTVNVAGLYYATSGIFFHHCCQNVWLDPDRTVLSDPYLRVVGWQGQIANEQAYGRPVACGDGVKDQVRGSAGAAYYASTLTGGLTIQYGAGGWGQRLNERIGTSVKDPFIVRVQDWGLSGPTEGTCPYAGGCTVGARGRSFSDINFFKGDPHHRPDLGGTPVRFARVISLPTIYGNGFTHAEVGGCADTNNGQPAGDDGNTFRLENNQVGQPTRDWSFELVGDWRTTAQGGTWTRGTNALFIFSFYEDSGPSKSYRNTLLAGPSTTIPDLITLNDTSTVAGPGTFTNLATADGYGPAGCTANTIRDATVSGTITIASNCGTTTISNVNMTGVAQDLISVGSSSVATLNTLCMAAGKRIVGAGSATLNGVPITLPYTVPAGGLTACTPSTDTVPLPPSGGGVN